jgi:hypothetical protein
MTPTFASAPRARKSLEAMLCLKRRLSDVVFHALQKDLADRAEGLLGMFYNL